VIIFIILLLFAKVNTMSALL